MNVQNSTDADMDVEMSVGSYSIETVTMVRQTMTARVNIVS